MKKVISSIKRKATGAVATIKRTVCGFAASIAVTRMKRAFACSRGEGFVDTAVKILISIVVGALILTALFLLFGDVVMPTLTQRIRDMFNFTGA